MIFFSGPPGSGKTTQAKILAAKLGCPHISVGELLRKELGPEQINKMRQGELIEDRIVFSIIEKRLAEFRYDQEIVIDGALRTENDVIWLKNLVGSKKVFLTAIVFLELTDEEIRKRLLARGRLDDSLTSINERLEIFHNSDKAIKQLLGKERLKFYEIDGEDSVDEVSLKVQEVLNVA